MSGELFYTDGNGRLQPTTQHHQLQEPVRPYVQQGRPSAGYAEGASTSQAAEPQRAGSQLHVLRLLAIAGTYGVTGHEANDALGVPKQTNGQAALSVLHGEGLVARLVEKRDKQKVYVLPHAVAGRPTEQRGRHGRKHCPHCGGEL